MPRLTIDERSFMARELSGLGSACPNFARSPCLPSWWWIRLPERTVLPAFKTELQRIVVECQPESTTVIMANDKTQRVGRF